ncbi:MAG: hypothetical protein IKI21_00140 [Oscillospiraceae bacterium]|nr:hypothetical protein [Oscillospiraceae bacterium]
MKMFCLTVHFFRARSNAGRRRRIFGRARTNSSTDERRVETLLSSCPVR